MIKHEGNVNEGDFVDIYAPSSESLDITLNNVKIEINNSNDSPLDSSLSDDNNNTNADTTDGDNDSIDSDDELPDGGNPDGQCPIPDEAKQEDVSVPDRVIGNGTPASCTSAAVVQAVAQGGIITFNCGPDPVTIPMDETAKIFNDTGPKIVIDGGGKVYFQGGPGADIGAEKEGEQQPGEDTACKEPAHRFLGIEREENHGGAGWDEDSERRAGHD